MDEGRRPGATEETKQNVERIFNQEVDTSAAKVRDKLLRAEPLTDKEKYEGRGSSYGSACAIPPKSPDSKSG